MPGPQPAQGVRIPSPWAQDPTLAASITTPPASSPSPHAQDTASSPTPTPGPAPAFPLALALPDHDPSPMARPSMQDWGATSPSSEEGEGEGAAAFDPDFSLGPAHVVSNHMDPIYEESERTSLTLAEMAEVEAAAAAAAAAEYQAHQAQAEQPESSSLPPPPAAGAHLHLPSSWLIHQQRSSMNSPGSLHSDEADSPGGSRCSARSSAPTAPSLAAAAAERRRPLLQRISSSFRHAGTAATPERRPSGEGQAQGQAAERSSLMQKVGMALSRVSTSFRPSSSDSPREGAAAPPHGPSTEELPSRSRGGGRENRALGASSVPVAPAYAAEAGGAGGRPNLRRRGCYTGLVDSYRMRTVVEGVATVSAPLAAEQDEQRLSELISWLADSSQPWKQHSRRLHKLQLAEQIEEAQKEAQEPKPVLPQAPSKPKLKTFSMAYR